MDDQEFTEGDRANLIDFVGHVLEQHKAGTLEQEVAAGALVSTMTALAAGELWRARAWFEEGRQAPSAAASS
jgi:hypothetical protein